MIVKKYVIASTPSDFNGETTLTVVVDRESRLDTIQVVPAQKLRLDKPRLYKVLNWFTWIKWISTSFEKISYKGESFSAVIRIGVYNPALKYQKSIYDASVNKAVSDVRVESFDVNGENFSHGAGPPSRVKDFNAIFTFGYNLGVQLKKGSKINVHLTGKGNVAMIVQTRIYEP